nr:MAG TPA: hypothetical protein [Caudoviricetes sp.]
MQKKIKKVLLNNKKWCRIQIVATVSNKKSYKTG